MPLSDQDIRQLATLSRLEISADEVSATQRQLNDIFALVEKMQAIDTKGVEPLTHPIGAIKNLSQRLRADAVTETDAREANQHNAPALEDGLFLVPKVIE